MPSNDTNLPQSLSPAGSVPLWDDDPAIVARLRQEQVMFYLIMKRVFALLVLAVVGFIIYHISIQIGTMLATGVGVAKWKSVTGFARRLLSFGKSPP